jgi:hypothetical protein
MPYSRNHLPSFNEAALFTLVIDTDKGGVGRKNVLIIAFLDIMAIYLDIILY